MDIEDILSKHKDLVDRKFREYNGLVSRETAAFIVAQEIGLKIEEEVTPELTVSQLTAGMRKVALTGKVLAAGPTDEYTKKDGTLGHVQRLIVQDESDRVEVALWEPPDEEIRTGQIIKITGAYVKNLEETLQLNIPDRGSVETLGFEPLRLDEVLDGVQGLTVIASVLNVYPDKLFEAKRGGVFRASSLTLFQDSWKARVVFWEEEAEMPANLQAFQEVELSNLKASVDYSGLIGLTASVATTVVARGEIEPVEPAMLTPREIVHPELDVTIHGIVSSVSIETDRLSIILSDQLAEIRLVVLHNEAVASLKTLTQGCGLTARCVDVVQNPSGQLEARSSIWSGFLLE
jgi:ssDNA-binding replication factor A large subunit